MKARFILATIATIFFYNQQLFSMRTTNKNRAINTYKCKHSLITQQTVYKNAKYHLNQQNTEAQLKKNQFSNSSNRPNEYNTENTVAYLVNLHILHNANILPLNK